MNNMRFIAVPLLIGCLLTPSAFAQKNIVKKIGKICSKQASKHEKKTRALKPAVKKPSWRPSKESKQITVDPLLIKVLSLKTKTAQEDYLFFKMFDKEQGLLGTMAALHNELLDALYFSVTNRSRLPHTTPAELRKRLLEAEQSFIRASNNWRKFPPLQTQEQSIYHKLQQEPDLRGAAFFMEQLSNSVRSTPNANHLDFTFPQNHSFQYMAKQILAWAHGERQAYPFLLNKVFLLLELQGSTSRQIANLYQTLDSSGCTILREWGWTNADIRKAIDLYQQDNHRLLQDIAAVFDFSQLSAKDMEYMYKNLDCKQSLQFKQMFYQGPILSIDSKWEDVLKLAIPYTELGLPFFSIGTIYHDFVSVIEQNRYYWGTTMRDVYKTYGEKLNNIHKLFEKQ